MKMPLSQNLIKLAAKCSFPLYVVGGSVRDFLANLKSSVCDTDICAPASADAFVAAAVECGAQVCAIYRNTGTVKIKLCGEEYEFACFRSDEYVRGEHTPARTYFTDDIYLDARRRDFKCNAVYYDISSGNFCDPLGGIKDIENKILSTVAPAEKVFGEDGLRLMRLARQSAQTGFSPSAECLRGAQKNCALIADVSMERVYAELNAILHADKKYGVQGAQYRGLKLLEEAGVLKVILPELYIGKGMKQNEKFHNHDVLEHSLRTVLYADESVRLAALLHDIGKPFAYNERGNFYAHELDSARIAEEVCARFRVSKKTTAEVVRLCGAHMYDTALNARESKVRKFIVRNVDIFEKILLIKQADYSACRDDLSVAPCVVKWRAIYEKMLKEGVPLSLKQLAVKGDELIKHGVPPAQAGKALYALLEGCAAGVLINDRQKLLSYAQKTFL